ncbi:MAG TPA: hypothetical protein PKW95_11660 [bacterium]|nr:hypothetical protein [bacterium]
MIVLRTIAGESGPLFIVGSCKNAGKTTLLNFLNRELSERLSVPPALATIGRDGEAEDIIWRHPKPPVTLRPGNLFVTTDGECARLGDGAQRLERLPFRTMLGTVVVGRALRDGNVEIIGPDTNAELWTALERLKILGATHMLVDGAYERRTQVAAHDGARLALVVSADVAPEPEGAAAWLAHQVELYALPAAPPELSPDDDLPLGLHWRVGDRWRAEPRDATAACCVGPLTDEMVETHLDELRAVPLIVEDATKVFVDRPAWRKLRRKSPGVFVRRTLRLLLVAANPHGLLRQWEPQSFFAQLLAAAPHLPLLDVVAGLRHEP